MIRPKKIIRKKFHRDQKAILAWLKKKSRFYRKKLTLSFKKACKKYQLGKIFLIIGFIFLSFWLMHKSNRWSILAQSLRANFAQKEEKRQPKIVSVSIPKLVSVEVKEAIQVGSDWVVGGNTASHQSSSANPGEAGNIIIFGHNKSKVFGNLRKVKPGAVVSLKTEAGSEHQYLVSLVKEVDPKKNEYLDQGQNEILTLYTCSGFLDRKRLIVQAKPL